jgi:hypothetical protein
MNHLVEGVAMSSMSKTLSAGFFVGLLCTANPCFLYGGEKPSLPEPRTELEAFLSKTGHIVVKEFHFHGKLEELSGSLSSGVELSTVILYEPGKESQRKKGLWIKVKEASSYERSDTSFLDVDEIESLSKAIDYMTNLAQQWAGKPRDYTEVIFSTKGDFQLGFYVSDGKPSAFAKSGRGVSASAYFPMATLQKVKEAVDRALAHLNAH